MNPSKTAVIKCEAIYTVAHPCGKIQLCLYDKRFGADKSTYAIAESVLVGTFGIHAKFSNGVEAEIKIKKPRK